MKTRERLERFASRDIWIDPVSPLVAKHIAISHLEALDIIDHLKNVIREIKFFNDNDGIGGGHGR